MDAKRLVGGLALLGAAFAGGYVVGGGGVPTTPAPLEVVAEADQVEPQAPPGGELRASRPSLAPATAESALVPAALSAALAALPPLDVPPGDHLLEVIVRTDRGDPLSGVEVRLLPAALPDSLQWPADMTREQREQQSLATHVLYFTHAMRWQTEGRRVATTDADGCCSFERVHDVVHNLDAALDGWTIVPAPRSGSSSFRPGVLAELVAKPTSGVVLDVRLPDGSAPKLASAAFRTSRRERNKRWMEASPFVELDPDVYDLVVTAGEAGELRSAPQTITIERAQAPATVRVDLVERPTLRLRLDLDAAEKVHLLRVAWSPLPHGSPVSARALAHVRRPRALHARARSSFQHVEHGLEPGPYVLGVYRGYSKTPALVQGMEVGPGLTDVEVTLPLPERSEVAVLRVRGPDGQPLSPLEFRTSFRGKRSNGSASGVPYVERPDGEYWIYHQPVEGPTDGGRFSIAVAHRDLGTRVVTYEAGELVDQVVRFDEPGFVHVSVPGLAGHGLGDRVRVWLAHPEGRRDDTRLGPTLTGNGSARLAHLQPGIYRARLRIAYGQDDDLTVDVGDVEVRSGEQAVRLDMPPLQDVAFEGLGTDASLKRLADEGNEYDSIGLGPIAEGRAGLAGLPAGRYELRTGAKTVPFTLPGPSLVRVE